VVLTLQAALAAQQSQLDQVLNKLAIQQARMTPTIADTITETVDLSALTAQAALSSQALVELLKRTSVSSSPDNHGNSSELSDSSSSSDDSSTSFIHGASKKKPKKQSSRKVRVKRKQKLYQCLLKNAKTVRDDQTSFKRLAQNSDPKVRRTTYNEWIKQIKKCCQMLPEFNTLFDPTDPSFIVRSLSLIPMKPSTCYFTVRLTPLWPTTLRHIKVAVPLPIKPVVFTSSVIFSAGSLL